jgi:DNA-binding LacI/PurR family transcriptional regulator
MVRIHRDNDKRPKYLRLAESVRQQIEAGELKPNQQLMSYVEIEAEFGFSQNTVERAYAILEREGLISREHGRGVFVAERVAPKQSTKYIGYMDGHFHYTRNVAYYNILLNGARTHLQRSGRQLLLIDNPQSFRDWDQLDGLLLCEAGHDDDFDFDLQGLERTIPKNLPYVNTLTSLPNAPCVLADDASGIRQIMRHLFSLGHQRIAYLSRVTQPLPEQNPLVRLRYETYLAAHEEHGLEFQPEMVFPGFVDFTLTQEEYGYQGMKKWLQAGWQSLGCTALMAQNDMATIGAIRALSEAGLRIPDDISVVGFDGTETFHFSPYQLTTVKVPLHEIGMAASQTLLHYIAHPEQQPASLTLPVHLSIGGSTGPAVSSGLARTDFGDTNSLRGTPALEAVIAQNT